MTDVRALTVRQPWAWAIAHGGKRIENRTHWTSHRGPVLIHAGLGFDIDQIDLVADLSGFHPNQVTEEAEETRGTIVAVANLADTHPGVCSPRCAWGEDDVWHWRLTDVVALPKPVAARGALGLWRPPVDVLLAVHAQVPILAAAS